MEICLKWMTLGILFFHIPLIFGYYPEYVIEHFCQKGNEQILYNITKIGSAGRIIPSTHLPYETNKNCTIVILAPPNVGIVLSVRKIDFRQPGLTCLDYIKIYHSDTRFSPSTLCQFKFDLREKLSYYSKEMIQFIYHVGSKITDGIGAEEGFDLTFTVVTEDEETCKAENFFECDNGRCVPHGLTCDLRNNCGDNSDEASVICDPVPTFNYFDYNSISFGLLVGAFLFIISLTCLLAFTTTKGVPATDELPATITPFNAIHPSGYFFSRNPRGAQAPQQHYVKYDSEGYVKPHYPSGVPPPPYEE